MSSIVLFDDKKDCCGCGACMNVCPKNAIRMAEDEVGFVYPEIDQNLCVGCGVCKKACGYQMQPLMQKSEAVYAAASNNDNLLRKSASGGAFAVLAENVLKKVVWYMVLHFLWKMENWSQSISALIQWKGCLNCKDRNMCKVRLGIPMHRPKKICWMEKEFFFLERPVRLQA